MPLGVLINVAWAAEPVLGYKSVPLSQLIAARISHPDHVTQLSVWDLSTAMAVTERLRTLATLDKRKKKRTRKAGTARAAVGDSGPSDDYFYETDANASSSDVESDPIEARPRPNLVGKQSEKSETAAPPVPRRQLVDCVANILQALRPHLETEGAPHAALPATRAATASSEPGSGWQNTALLNSDNDPANFPLNLTSCAKLLYGVVKFLRWPVACDELESELLWTAERLLLKTHSMLQSEPAQGSASELQTLLWAYAALNRRFVISASDASIVADLLVPCTHSLPPSKVSHCFWALERLQLKHARLLAVLMREVEGRLAEFSNEALVHVTHAMALLGIRNDPLMDRVALTVSARLEDGGHVGLNHSVRLVHAFALNKRFPYELMVTLMRAIRATHALNREKADTATPRNKKHGSRPVGPDLNPEVLSVLAWSTAEFYEHCPQHSGLVRSQASDVLLMVEHMLGAKEPSTWTIPQLERLRKFMIGARTQSICLLDIMELLDQARQAEAAVPTSPPPRTLAFPQVSAPLGDSASADSAFNASAPGPANAALQPRPSFARGRFVQAAADHTLAPPPVRRPAKLCAAVEAAGASQSTHASNGALASAHERPQPQSDLPASPAASDPSDAAADVHEAVGIPLDAQKPSLQTTDQLAVSRAAAPHLEEGSATTEAASSSHPEEERPASAAQPDALAAGAEQALAGADASSQIATSVAAPVDAGSTIPPVPTAAASRSADDSHRKAASAAASVQSHAIDAASAINDMDAPVMQPAAAQSHSDNNTPPHAPVAAKPTRDGVHALHGELAISSVWKNMVQAEPVASQSDEDAAAAAVWGSLVDAESALVPHVWKGTMSGSDAAAAVWTGLARAESTTTAPLGSNSAVADLEHPAPMDAPDSYSGRHMEPARSPRIAAPVAATRSKLTGYADTHKRAARDTSETAAQASPLADNGASQYDIFTLQAIDAWAGDRNNGNSAAGAGETVENGSARTRYTAARLQQQREAESDVVAFVDSQSRSSSLRPRVREMLSNGGANAWSEGERTYAASAPRGSAAPRHAQNAARRARVVRVRSQEEVEAAWSGESGSRPSPSSGGVSLSGSAAHGVIVANGAPSWKRGGGQAAPRTDDAAAARPLARAAPRELSANTAGRSLHRGATERQPSAPRSAPMRQRPTSMQAPLAESGTVPRAPATARAAPNSSRSIRDSSATVTQQRAAADPVSMHVREAASSRDAGAPGAAELSAAEQERQRRELEAWGQEFDVKGKGRRPATSSTSQPPRPRNASTTRKHGSTRQQHLSAISWGSVRPDTKPQ